MHSGLVLVAGKDILERRRLDTQHHTAEYLQEPAVRVVGWALIAHESGQALRYILVDAEVQDGVHHPRHGISGTRTYRYQEWVGRRPEFSPDGLLEPPHVFSYVLPQPFGKSVTSFVLLPAGFGCDGEPGRHGESQTRHLSHVGALTAQQVTHTSIAFVEPVNALLALRNHVLSRPRVSKGRPHAFARNRESPIPGQSRAVSG